MTDFETFYKEAIKELKKEDQWTNFSHLYENDGRKNDILGYFREETEIKWVVRLEKVGWKEREAGWGAGWEVGVAHGSAQQQQAEMHDDKPILVPSVSVASKDHRTRAKYRNQVVSDKNFDGAFVAHEMFVEFVKKSNRMVEVAVSDKKNDDNDDVNHNYDRITPGNIDNDEWNTKVDALSKFAAIIFRRRQKSLNCDHLNIETVQSMLATELIRFALQQEWEFRNSNDAQRRCPIMATHQSTIYFSPKKGYRIISKTKNSKQNSASEVSMNDQSGVSKDDNNKKSTMGAVTKNVVARATSNTTPPTNTNSHALAVRNQNFDNEIMHEMDVQPKKRKENPNTALDRPTKRTGNMKQEANDDAELTFSVSQNIDKPGNVEKEEQVNQSIDVLIWFPHKKKRLGNCVLSNIEYKPSDSNETARVAQADMYTTNIMDIHDLPCISIDIAGGKKCSKWKITATAIILNNPPVDPVKTRWCKSLLFTGQGVKGICSIAAGLVAAYINYPIKKKDFGCRLGPVVGHIEKKVVKAYVNAKYRKPNLNLVQKNIDPNAKLYSTTNNRKKIQILEMTYVEGTWIGDIKISTFREILKKLLQLHNYGLVHGDVRLANMLSAGVLIDFDLAGQHGRATYPYGFQLITQDGKRHRDIETAIRFGSDNAIASVTLKTCHDCFSMAFVMTLFVSDVSNIQQRWESAVANVRSDELNKAIKVLSKVKGKTVRLAKKDLAQLFGTGGTPKKNE
jgi:hypothetical protein